MVPARSRCCLSPEQICGTQAAAPGPARLRADVPAPRHMDTPCPAIWDKLWDAHTRQAGNLGVQNVPGGKATIPQHSLPGSAFLPPSDGRCCGLITKSNIQELPALPEALQRRMVETWEAPSAPGIAGLGTFLGKGGVFSQSSRWRERKKAGAWFFGGDKLGMQLPTIPSLLPGSSSVLNGAATGNVGKP